MVRLFFILFAILSYGIPSLGLGQTFTYDSSNSGCDGQWSTGACWDVENVNSCSSPNSAPPPTNAVGCEVNIFINGDITYSGNLEFGGTFGTLNIGNGAQFDLTGDVIISSDKKMDFQLTGESKFNVDGELVISLGSSSDSTMLYIDGDGSSYMFVNSIDLRGRAILEVGDGGALVSSGPTAYNGNSSKINVYGFFRTNMIDIQGGNKHQLNSYGNAEIIVEEDIVLGGTSGITFNGDSEVYVGGDIDNNNGAEIIASDNAKVYYCGEIKKPPKAFEYDNGDFEYGCRILPVDWGGVNLEFDKESYFVLVSWTTLKEWDNGRFVVERSSGGVDKFKEIGEVISIGWSDSAIDYQFEDHSFSQGGERYYYRIKQIGLNGDYSYSQTVSVIMPEIISSQRNWSVFPNPAKGKTIEVKLLNNSAYKGEEISVRVFNAVQTSQTLNLKVLEGLNPSVGELVRQFSRGFVIIEIRWGNQIEFIKLIN
ncbi:hypothetical protein QWY93_05625 [Echinicola jeungdonensis]|uniref:Secretion system C-terminal sorting domain-containing protein n=1 Tax=Echinicola jeungdonensis TaxID=709343 RepID=A0ABV5J5U5_9BACT|nr:hypothetical protein [Echinicola jeungdonensis]MDN3668802.1 hypothetical protein [Echinicola jeungdonensis]